MHKNAYWLILILFVLARIAVAQSPTLLRGPYLQVVTPTSVIVRWRTDQPTVGKVWFGLSDSQLTTTAGETTPTLEHVVTLTGLQPATRYTYAIGYDNVKLAAGADYYAKTALPTGDKRPFRMWVLGDFGVDNENQKKVYQQFRNATADRPADLWVWLGDNAYSAGLEDEFQRTVFSVYQPSLRNLPLFITPGNHDYADSEVNFNIAYYKLFSFPQQGEAGGVPSGSKSYYSANYGNVHLVSLDSQGRMDGQYRLYDTTSTQVQWLKRDLAANTLPWTIVIFHHPPYSKGSHNSDTEESMRLIRENLTPILERYGVDLVLSGHSHGYERSYRLKGLRGLANTFDKTSHLAETTNGRYDGSPNSCPILTKGQGTIYIVNGSGGQLGGQSPGYPHPATVYNNVTTGGSMVLDMNDNRLDAQLILGDGSVGDRFTLMKQVNKAFTLTTEYADTLLLSASWPGNYQWSDGQTSRTARYVAKQPGTFSFTAKDDKQCLTDQFTITVQQPPKLTTQPLSGTAFCGGSSIPVVATPENTTKAAGWQYDVLLSDPSGSFSNAQSVGSGSISALRATLPPNLALGTGYRLQVKPRGISYVQLVASDAFTVKALPTATVVGSATVLKGESVTITLSFTGDGPWQGTLSDGTTFSSTVTPLTVSLRPTKSTAYTVASVENSCGKGSGSGQALVTVLLPTAEEVFPGGQLKLYPNPAHEIVHVELTLNQPKDVSISLYDTQGRMISQKHVGNVRAALETISLPSPSDVYLLKLQLGDSTITRKIVRQ